MNPGKILRNYVWLIADKTRKKLGEKRFLDLVNENLNKSYDEVRLLWEKPETKVHGQTTPGVLKEMSRLITEELCLVKEDRVLDIGCGDGQIDFFLKKKCAELSGFDFSETKINEAKARNKEVSYFVASFLEDYKEKCRNINKVFSYGVMQYCKPEDVETFIQHSVEVLKGTSGLVMHLDVPDKDKMGIFYSLNYGVPIDMVNKMRDNISYIFGDGSYWHDMKKIKREVETMLKEFGGGGANLPNWFVSVENSDCYYRSNLRIEKRT